ncbi:hypothetical protein ACXIVK_36490 [Paraburkholderia caledonica]
MKALFIRWTLTFAAIGVAVVWAFFPQIRGVAADWYSGNTGMPTLLDSELSNVREIKFLGRDQIITNVTVSDLRVVAAAQGSATVGLTLASSEPTALYPSLRIYLQANHQTVRTVVIGPGDYEHQATLVSEPVRVSIRLQPGETGFTASAFYGAGGA